MPRRLLLTALPCCLLLTACALDLNDEDDPSGDTTPQDSSEATTYAELKAALDVYRSEYREPGARDLRADGARLFWTQTDQSGVPDVLHSVSEADNTLLTYDFTPTNRNQVLFLKTSEDLVVTAGLSSGNFTYTAYDASDSADTPLATLTLPEPSTGTQATYALDGPRVYIFAEDSAGEDALFRWLPETGEEPERLFNLRDAGILLTSNITDVAVSEEHLVVTERDGRIRLTHITNKSSLPIRTGDVQASIEAINPYGVLYRNEGDLDHFRFDNRKDINVSNRLRNRVDVIPERPNGHLATSERATLFGERTVIYIGDHGLFAYDLLDDTLRPLLIEAYEVGLFESFRDVVALDSGAIYLIALTSTSGATGNDGPLLRLDPGALVP